MGFQVSPGVQVKEIDLTNVVPAVSTSIGAIALPAEKGPVSSVTTISSEEDLVKYLVNLKLAPISLKLGLLLLVFYSMQINLKLFDLHQQL